MKRLWLDGYFSPGGVRKKLANGELVHGYEEAFNFFFNQPYVNGSYQFKLLHAETKAVITEKNVGVKITQKGCGSPDLIETSDSLDFSLPAPNDVPIDPTKDYLPLEDGMVLVFDPNTVTATKLGNSEIWKDVEVVREVELDASVGGPGSVKMRFMGEQAR